MSFFQNACKPDGFGGKVMVKVMNGGHSALARWGFSKLDTHADWTVLDAGCGGGANVAVWLDKCPNGYVTGLDYSSVSVAESKKVNDAAIQRRRCHILQSDVSAMPFPDAHFDCVSAFETVYFWHGLTKCFAGVNRVLKRGGMFMICNESDGTNASDKTWTKLIDGMTIYTEQQLRAALEEAGFSDIVSHADRKKHWLCVIARKA